MNNKVDELTTQDQFAAPTVREFTDLKNVVFVLVAVMAVALVTIIIQYFTATQATFEELRRTVSEQNGKIDSQNGKIDLLLNFYIKENGAQ